MARRSSPRRGRSRKRRSARQAAGEPSPDAAPRAKQVGAGAGRKRERKGARERGSGVMDLRTLGERPKPPWHPWPLSEIVILAGIVGTIVGAVRGAAGKPVLFAGIVAVGIGTLEFTVREHLSGFKSHTTLLAFIPTVAFHTAVALGLAVAGASTKVAVITPLVLDLPVFALLFKLLRERFLVARREVRLAQRR